jgi:hypothetical protein
LIALTALIALSLSQADAGFIENVPDAGPGPVAPSALAAGTGIFEYVPDGGFPALTPSWLHLHGNKVLPEEVYMRVLSLPEYGTPDEDTAHGVERDLFNFLVESGYELATVRAVPTDAGIDVTIDEGRLEKIVFRGRLTAQTLRFRLGLFIDQEIFNRPSLERQIAKLERESGVKVVRWALVPTPNPEHMGPQLDDIPAIEGFEILHARKQYELHFFFEEAEWDTGVGLDLRSGYIDGLELGINYQGKDILLKGERLRLAASIGAGLRDSIDGQHLYPAFSRTFAEVVWYAPKKGRVRPYVWLTGQLVGRQRADLGLENYNEGSAITSGHLAISFTDRFKATFGLGFQWRRVFNLVYATSVPNIEVPLTERLRAFVDGHIDWLLEDETERSDRAHALRAGVRWYTGRSIGDTVAQPQFLQYGWVDHQYQVVIPFGWHDLWLKSQGRFTWGDVQFHDEQNLGELMRGVFGNTYVRKAGNASAEFRFSLSRDVLKLSVFAQAAAWGEVTRVATATQPVNSETFRYGGSAGPGFHALIQGMFQLDIYASFGLMSTGRFGVGAVAWLNKVF